MESKYNPYLGVDENKKRPIMIWNNSYQLKGKVIGFYCTTKKNNYNKNFLIKYSTKNDGTECFVNLSRMFVIDIKDIDFKNNRWFKIKDQETRNKIINLIDVMFNNK